MNIALLGSRGIPARYSGFETFYEQLAIRLVQRGHVVNVYNRRYFMLDGPNEFQGVKIISLPSIPTKHLDTISHCLLSSLHALFKRYDVAYYCIVGNSPLVWIPRMVRAKVLLNVDGEDWRREKWSRFAQWYQRWCEKVATRTATMIVADAQVIQRRYLDVYQAETVFVPYGANVCRQESNASLQKWGLKPRQYVLYVGRFVPENSIEVLIRAFKEVRTDMKLVLVGDAPYSSEYKQALYKAAEGDPRVVFTGYAFEQVYSELSSHAYLYVQPSAINGTRPALLDQLGFGNCVLVRDAQVNIEVIGECGARFAGDQPEKRLRERLQDLINDPGEVERFRQRSTSRITDYYNWEWVTDFYEYLFSCLIKGGQVMSYDEFLIKRQKGDPLGTGGCPPQILSSHEGGII
jgi:glycosyltransferase involved in cell wall biosynthesis